MGKLPFLRPDPGAGCFHVENPLGLDVRLFASEEVPFERESFDQLFEFLDVARAVEEVRTRTSFFGDAPAGVDRVVLTPDFHKGSLVPVGTIARAQHLCIPQAIGNDVCCGMRLLVTDLSADALDGHWPARGRATHVEKTVFDDAMEKLRVVGPIDPRAPTIARRRDIVEKYEKRLMEEAPYAYKAVEPVVDSVEGARIARKVARLWPLCTVKG